MSAVSLINPYAPQPVGTATAETAFAATQTAPPITASGSAGNSGLASDHSGQGAGNGTGTGGAHLAGLLKRARQDNVPQKATPESVVEAQSESDPATEFLARQARQQIEAKAAEEARIAERAAARAAEAKEAAEQAALPEYVMPNPLPTAPILKRDDG